MIRKLFALVFISGTLVLGACNTIEGVQGAVASVGDTVADAAK